MNNKNNDPCLYQVIDFVANTQFQNLKLLPIDQLILIQLARYSGHLSRGIYPGQKTLAKKLNVCDRTVRRRLKVLERFGIIFRQKVGRHHEYSFPFLSTDFKGNSGHLISIDRTKVVQQRTPRVFNSGHLCPIIEVINEKNNINLTTTQEERKEAEQLPQRLGDMMKEWSIKEKDINAKNGSVNLDYFYHDLVVSEPIRELEQNVS